MLPQRCCCVLLLLLLLSQWQFLNSLDFYRVSVVIADCFVHFSDVAVADDAAVHSAVVVAALFVAVADYKNVASVSASNSSKHQPAKNVTKCYYLKNISKSFVSLATSHL